MSSSRDPNPIDPAGDDAEVVDGEVVGIHQPDPPPARGRVAMASPPAPAPARQAGPGGVPVLAQAAAVAATGFAAGAVTAAVVRRASRRRSVRSSPRAKGALPVIGTRSFLVDVHLLGPRD